MNLKTKNRPFFFLLFFSVFLWLSCSSPVENSANPESFQEKYAIEIRYAKGFSIRQSDQDYWLVIHDPSINEAIDSINLQGRDSTNFRYFKNLAALSTTHFAFFQKINGLEQLKGLCGLNYLTPTQKKEVPKIKDVCGAEGIDPELILNIGTDLVFLYPFDDQNKEKLKRLGVKTLMITEYLESHPLGRSEWIKVFSLLIGKNPNESGFSEIESSYLALKKEVLNESQKTKPNLAFNLPFNDHWDMPSGKSISATLAEDAGFNYLLGDKKVSGNIVMQKEEAYELLARAEVWIIAAARPESYSLEDLKKENRIYGTFPSVINQRVFFCNTESSPYFSEGPVEPHVLLQDLIQCRLGQDKNNKYFKILR